MSCEVPRGSRGDNLKTIRKDRATEGLLHKFELNAFQVTGNHSQEDEDKKSTAARTTQDAIISTAYKYELLNDRIKAFDMMGAVLVPILKDEKGSTPADRWDFTERKNLLFNHSIPYKSVLQWGSDCVRFGINPTPVIPGMTLERQEQDWL